MGRDYYVDHLAAVNKTNQVLACEDIRNEQGVLLVAKGTPITSEIARKVALHKLVKPVETSVSLKSSVSIPQLFKRLQDMPKSQAFVTLQETTGFDKVFCNHCKELLEYPLIQQKLTVFADRLPGFCDKTLVSAYISLVIAAELKLDPDKTQHVFLAAMTRDLGLLHIDPALVNKKGTLSPQEWRMLQGHVVISHYFLTQVPSLPKLVARAVLEHHERTDGLGYPHGKIGGDLCQEGQVVAVADMIIAISTKQLEPLGYSMQAAISLLQLNGAVHFREVTDAAIRMLRGMALTFNRVYSDKEVCELIKTLIAKQKPLSSWFNKTWELIVEISQSNDGKYIRKTNALLARIQAILISSGLLAEEQRQWLEQVLREGKTEDYLDVESTALMLDELSWQFRQLSNTLALALENLNIPEKEKNPYLERFTRLEKLLNDVGISTKEAA